MNSKPGFLAIPENPDSLTISDSIFDNISVTGKEDLPLAQRFLDKHFNKGLCGYCLIDYEAGYLFEPKIEGLLKGKNKKLIQIFFFDKENIQKIKSTKIDFNFLDENEYKILDFKLNTSEKKYFRDIRKIKRYLRAGDSYQVNYTVKEFYLIPNWNQ